MAEGDDPTLAALDALTAAQLEPSVRRAILPVRMPNRPRALKTAMDALEAKDQVIDSILVMPGLQGNKALVSFGVEGEMYDGWEQDSAALRDYVEQALAGLE